MVTDTASLALSVANDAQDKIKILQDNISALVDEKAELVKEGRELVAANERLATTLKEVIAEKEELRVELALVHPQTGYDGPQRDPEKEELRRQLAVKSGMGIQENIESFADLVKQLPLKPSTAD